METETCVAPVLLRCYKCGETKPEDEFHIDRARISGRRNACKVCCAKRQSAYGKNRYASIKDVPGYKEVMNEKCRLRNRKKYATSAEFRQSQIDRSRRRVAELDDIYIKELLGLRTDEVTPELLELKREQMIVARAVKELLNAIKEIQK